jgi:hypothetical protein
MIYIHELLRYSIIQCISYVFQIEIFSDNLRETLENSSVQVFDISINALT